MLTLYSSYEGSLLIWINKLNIFLTSNPVINSTLEIYTKKLNYTEN